MQDYKNAATSMAKNLNLFANLKTINSLSVRNYQLAIEIFIYAITQTCPDFIYSVFIFSKFSVNLLK